jgi:membrane dipeptidase
VSAAADFAYAPDVARSVLGFALVLLGGCVSAPVVARGGEVTPPRFAVDTHVHLTMAQAAAPLFHGEPGDGRPLTQSPRNRLENQVDAATLRAAGVRLVYGALWPPLNARVGQSPLDAALGQVRRLEDFSLRRGDFALVGSASAARAAVARGAIAVFPQLEGAEGVGRVEDVDRLYAAGVRCITLVHFVSSQLGGAAAGQLGKALVGSRGSPREPLGLTPLGRDVVRRMMALGVVIDLAHASDALAAEVLDLTEPAGVPVIVSHAGARALTEMERNVPDALAQRVAAGGGLIGVTAFEAQLRVEPHGEQHRPGTCDDLVAHWRHFAQVVPPSALVLGSDFNSFITRAAPGGACPRGLRNAGDLQDVWAALVADGFPREALDDMGDRLLQLHERVEAKADPRAQAEVLRQFPRSAVRGSAFP